MGSDAHVIVVGGSAVLADRAHDRVDELERKWSRFLPDSEISRLNDNAGAWIEVSDDTIELIVRAVEAWHFTGAAFDPTVLGAVRRAGYRVSFESPAFDSRAGDLTDAGRDLVTACTDIEIEGNVVRLPARTGFDPGGIGKGLAADIVATELADSGADGACVNLGGDVRVLGRSAEGEGWTVDVEHPWQREPIATVGIADGGVATSTTLRRRWIVDGEQRHHLIDPRTGEPSDSDLNLVTVVAGTAWAAEVLAKAVLLRGSAHPFDIIEGSGAHALVVDDAGSVVASSGFRDLVG